MNVQAEIRLGAVSYLNTKPLVHGLAKRLPAAEIIFDLPSRLADRLASGTLDVALIPSIEFFQRPDYRIVSDACIACRGPVWSVKLFSHVPGPQIRSLALDEGSRTSAALSRILLRERFGLTPQLLPLPIEANPHECAADALLLIGDRAIHEPVGPWNFVWDLGEQWKCWSGLPFVFAMWVARPGIAADRLAMIDRALQASRDDGLAHLPELAQREAAPLKLTNSECESYWRDNLYFYLGEREQRGLALYYRHAMNLGLAPQDHAWCSDAAPVLRKAQSA